MGEPLVISKKLLASSIFGVLIIGLAFYISNKQNNIPIIIQAADVDTSQNSNTYDTIAETTPTDAVVKDAKPLTQTDILTRNVIGPYLKQLKDGNYSRESSQQIVQKATDYMLQLSFTPTIAQELNITTDTNKPTVEVYKAELQQALQPIFNLKEYELTIYARAIRDNSKQDFDSLAEIATVYNNAALEALKVAVPTDVSAVHLAIVNSLRKFSVILTELSKGYDDPAASLSGTANFTQAEEELGRAFEDLKTYFILKKVYNTSI